MHHVGLPTTTDVQQIIDKNASVFQEGLGEVVGVTAQLHVTQNAQPSFCRARPVPHALKAKVEKELDRLEKQKVIEAVQYSEWVAPIVPILKPDGSIRICGDYKLTINKVVKPDVYPLPRVEDLFANLAGGKAFTKLDLAHVYQQIPLDEVSKQYVTINTHTDITVYHLVCLLPLLFFRE